MPSMDRMRFDGIMAWIDIQMEKAEAAMRDDRVAEVHLDDTIVETLIRGVTESASVRNAVVLTTFQRHGMPGCGLLVDLYSALSNEPRAMRFTDDRNAVLVTIVFCAFMGGRPGTAHNYARHVTDSKFVEVLDALLESGHTAGEVLEGMNLDEMLQSALEGVDA